MQEQNLRQICLQKICAQQNNSKLHQCNRITMKNISLEITPIRRFTFHYVSINSKLLIFFTCLTPVFTSHYVSINSLSGCVIYHHSVTFTSHYVSINSGNVIKDAGYSVYLHPTMYLLIPHQRPICCHNLIIYIPLCIY